MAKLPDNIIITDAIGVGVGSIHAPEMSEAEAQNEAAEVTNFRKNIDWHNPAVCIDGRCCSKSESGTQLPLGAHLAGVAQSLLVAAKSVGYYLEGAELIAKAKERGFTVGAHCDTTNKSQSFENGTGCGANDKIDLITQQFVDQNEAVGSYTKALIGDSFDAEIFANMQLVSPSVDKNALMNCVGEDNVETLEDDGFGVHGHREQMVVFNYEENTTIDRDAYFNATGKQVFVVDVWYIKKLANEMASGPQAAKQASELFHAMIAYQVATYMGLCDGSHRAALLPANEVVAA